MTDLKSLYSDLAQGGPPLFFPDPPAEVTFNFDQGIAAQETFPLEDFKEIAVDVINRDEGRALEYISFGYDAGDDQIIYLSTYIELVLGYTGMREEIAAWLRADQGIDWLRADNLICTSGSVQAIALAVNALVNPGEGVLVEAASFPYAMRFMEMRGADLRTVELDEDGLVIASLEQRLQEMAADGVRPKMLYTIPTFQLPTGAVLPLERRRRLLEIAEEWDLVVLEDAIYANLCYEGETPPSLLSMDSTGLVIQSSGLSKVLAPGLRSGWIAGRTEMIEALAAVRQDLGVSQWLSRLTAEYLHRGLLEPHIEKANAVYRHKRDVAVEAVREHCSEFVDVTVPRGGFYLWLALKDNFDWDKAAEAAALAGVFCRPGESFMGAEHGRGYLRLAFSHAPEHELRRGIAALGEAMRSAAGDQVAR
ncbi:MAG: PLP-dependent aminotransferase family protein [Nocardioidaceae bacterium]|nr:PLP-dependent aminotransferase family protein [Nocardioidaceae bacterium]